jgi:hypothetical protein
MFYCSELNANGLEELWVKAGVGDSTRYIPIHILSKKIGRSLCQVLPAVHTLTGCDYTSKVGTKHAALMANPEMHFKDFVMATGNLDTVIDKAEAYLTQVLKKGTTMKTMNQLRSHRYHHAKQSRLDDLPPTSRAIRLHIERAYLATNEMVSLNQSILKVFIVPSSILSPSYHHANPLTQDSLVLNLLMIFWSRRPCNPLHMSKV